MKLYLFSLLPALLMLQGCTSAQNAVERKLRGMSLREKVGQLFIIRPEALDPTIHWVTGEDLAPLQLQRVNERMRETASRYPVGGILLYAHNIADEKQLRAFIKELRSLGGHPLLCIDEEGGRVARIANNPAFRVPKYQSMAAIGATGDPQNAYQAGHNIGKYLKRYGFDIDFAPSADVNTNPENIIIGQRAFSSDPSVAAPMVAAYVKGMQEAGIAACIKHFPGHGDTFADTHFGYAQSLKTWEEMSSCEMVTFREGIRAGVKMVMTAHISAPNVTGSEVPSTLSPIILQDKLRKELGFDGVIITDGMEMGAITRQYTSEEAAVAALQAGADILLGTRDYPKVFEAVVSAVESGRLSEERINQSVRRILALRQSIK